MTGGILAEATSVTDRLGVTRTVSITAFDRIGIPVWSTVRPRAAALVVNSGKGLDDAAAEVSARLECLEQVAAEQRPESARCTTLSFYEVMRVDAAMADYERVSACGEHIDPARRTQWLAVEDLLRCQPTFAPAESVLFPAPVDMELGWSLTTTRGLGCGLTRDAALSHAFSEVLERHVSTLVRTGALRTSRIDCDSAPPKIRELVSKVRRAGLHIAVRAVAFGRFWFIESLIIDPESPDPKFANGGYALALRPDKAAIASILEAVQSRAGYIHGAREDLPSKAPGDGQPSPSRHALVDRLQRHYFAGQQRRFPEFRVAGENSASELTTVLTGIRELGFASACCYDFVGPFDPFKVVRAVIPGAEDFTTQSPYLGRRLVRELRRLRRSDEALQETS